MKKKLSAIGILLVFLIILFNGIEKDVTEIVVLRKPPEAQKKARQKFNNDILILLLLKAVPATLIYFVTFYSLLPKTFHIMSTSKFSLYQFDELNTIFVFIEFGLLGFTIFAISKVYQLIKKYIE